MLWYGVNLVLTEQMTPGSLLVFLLYLGKMYKPMRDLSKMTDTLSKAAVGYERIHEVIETENEVRNLPGAREAPSFKGEIEFDHVYFALRAHYPHAHGCKSARRARTACSACWTNRRG